MSPPDPARTHRARALRHEATRAEHALWRGLRGRGLGGAKFRRQHPLDPFIVDFVCLARRLLVEVDGGQHAPELGGPDDRRRDAWLRAEGFRVLRVWNHEVLGNLDGVLQRIEEALTEVP